MLFLLWFAFKFVSLTYQTHFCDNDPNGLVGCDLLLNLYLWHIKHTAMWLAQFLTVLWFAFKFVSLTYQTHSFFLCLFYILRCDLLLNLYLWHIKHTLIYSKVNGIWLWFAFKFVSLTYQTHSPKNLLHSQTCCDLLLNLYLWHIKHTETP